MLTIYVVVNLGHDLSMVNDVTIDHGILCYLFAMRLLISSNEPIISITMMLCVVISNKHL